jgi:integrase/recombinase XerD
MNILYRFVYDRKKEAKKGLKDKAILQIGIRQKAGKEKYYSTNRYLKPSEWDNERKQVRNHYLSEQINDSLKKLVKKIEIAISKEGATVNSVLDYLKNQKQDQTFIDFMLNEINTGDLAPGTKKARKSVVEHIKNSGIVHFSQLTLPNIEIFDKYLKNHPDITEQSTINSKHRILINYINRAIKTGHISTNPYHLFDKKRIKKKMPIFLDKHELKAIEEKTFPSNKLQEVTDVYIFKCYTGMHYIDSAQFNYTRHTTTINNKTYILKTRQKTNEEFLVPLLPKAKEILEKYNYELPIKSNQKTNDYLKIIAEHCNIRKHLTDKTARNTFATTVCLLNGVNLKAVSKMLGHSSTRSTEIYAQATAEMLENESRKIK